MTPGTIVLLHTPHATADMWGDLPEALRSHGLDVVAPDVQGEDGTRYVARASLIIAATAPTAPLVLVGHGAAGPLLPGVALAQRAAHRKIGAYVFVDADLPRPLTDGHGLPMPPDWPEAPCGYLRTRSARDEHDRAAREARLRGWPVVEQTPPTDVAQAFTQLIAAL
ncbi:hypothetical protein Arub01_31140 [Actinomadura rubrobrunea]|uniref:Alpha/beta hydrolase n=1 Tax=Actinomadura rubrobrunea TaxID=115335 RepID=A0A9W6PUX0_9ACTN|nr:alpha/beta hydrolase [Actinomadura rubrobrunea]GLW64870.1 hypothetical protein Arub01_31140 [Actinomadura rubrobrunea]